MPVRAELAEQATLPVRNPLPGLAAVILHMGCIGASLGILAPLTALRFREWGAQSWEIGLSAAMTALALLIVLPIVARMPRLNPTTVMATGCAVGVVALVSMQLLPFVWAWIGLRLVAALGLTMPWLLGESWVNLAAPPHLRGRVVAAYASAFFVGFSLGPITIDAVGANGWPIILVGIAFLLGATLPLVIARKYAPPIALEAIRNPWPVLRRAKVVALAAVAAGLTESLCFGLFVVYGLDLGWGTSASLYAYSALLLGGILLQYPFGWLADRWSKGRMLAVVAILTIVSVIALSFVTMQPTLALFWAFLLGGGVLGFYSLGLTLLGEKFEGEDVIRANTGFLLAYQSGALIGPSTGGLAMTFLGPLGFTLVMGAVGLLLLAVTQWRFFKQ
ncbi:MFS transporter [Pedomonas mirosovicensis]|uniref:MFS transporter n=1 Tax=Pedomonas mirosovicensis TaxID=2908641 RepID=UPI0021697EEB|nr:MFS transporter [Pedomonas mirosovicensis]MCH8684836.1 MFS transporter [Pedomonas mirosovicensis]